ncbi:MAG: tRNA pseudouridine(55) synthase TruB [Flavobacteriaceae bacterium]|nr:tRNA pseudouridine(55) synthase TruB [Flavobacteriaceae bacterium]MCY4267132.1 tRNA pseudouridine(55) synthase TruB [Flavobacteriaceae bacterium]MCY4299914.1 tRNA pseudouridine(55) synthase TruB [Flavobacteriaceae bacterium]
MRFSNALFFQQELVDGRLILIDKPCGWTSFDVVKKIKLYLQKTYQIKKLKVGHAGTLDPLATGLLIVAVGKKTKKIQELQSLTKTYTGTLKLGQTTPSFDSETHVNAHYPIKHITEEMILEKAKDFIGQQMQLPPIYSAIKKDGKRLYQYARNGQTITINSRKINITEFHVHQINMPQIKFIISCSKGTYIRSLINDFGKKCNSGAYLISLRRTFIGDYSVDDALTIL